MTNEIELITHADRVALAAQEAVFVLSARHYRGRTRVLVTGPEEERTREVVEHRLGRGVDVLYCGTIPREVRPRPCRTYRELEPGCLQLRFIVHQGQTVASVEVAEDGDTVVVLGLVCMPVAGGDPAERMEHSYHVYLSRPLGERAVIDAVTRAPVPCRDLRLAA